jgi:nanoRNase/pAp phosphatase (c-di-AMP/oligoRNAs hydrolase)
MNVLGRALLDLTLVRDFAMAGVGRVDPVHRDAIPAAADFILQHERVETVLVYGVVGDRIDGSLRTHNPRLDCSHFLHSAFGADESGKSYGGGRWRKGGFQIPLHQLRLVGDDVATWPPVPSPKSSTAKSLASLRCRVRWVKMGHPGRNNADINASSRSTRS